MSNLIPIQDNDGVQAVMGRDLHAFLEVATAYKDWFPRMVAYGFEEEKDFSSFLSESTGGRPRQDHVITLDMAKEISMIQRTAKGKQAREYFIECERRAKAAAPALPQTYKEALVALLAEVEAKEKAEEEAQLMSQRLQVVEGTTGIIPGTFWTLAYGAKGKNIFIRKLRQMGFLYKQSQRLTMQGEATNLMRNWNRPIPDTDRTTMTAVIIPGKEWEFFQFVESTPELSGNFEPVVNSREELEARVEMVRNGGSL